MVGQVEPLPFSLSWATCVFVAVYTVWARPSTLAQQGEEAYLPSGDAFTLPVSEVCISMPWASLESEGQTTWQEGVVR